MKYYANFTANNSTSFAEPIESNNKTILIREIREIAEGETFAGNECRWWVENAEGETIAAGGMFSCGQRYRTV